MRSKKRAPTVSDSAKDGRIGIVGEKWGGRGLEKNTHELEKNAKMLEKKIQLSVTYVVNKADAHNGVLIRRLPFVSIQPPV